MDRKAVMVDVDGVLVTHPDAAGWGANLARDLKLSPHLLQEAFFTPHWHDVIHGRAALRDRLAPVLREIAPTLSCDTLIDYWFANDAHLDHRLLADLRQLRHDGVELHLATVQEHERARWLWERLDLRSDFDGLHYSAALGAAKPAPAFYRAVEAATGLAPPAIFFIDDNAANVAGARAAGWTAALWTGDDRLGDVMLQHGWRIG